MGVIKKAQISVGVQAGSLIAHCFLFVPKMSSANSLLCYSPEPFFSFIFIELLLIRVVCRQMSIITFELWLI